MEETVYNNNSEMELEITKVSWWAILLEGVIAVLVGLFLLLRPATTTVLLIQVLGIYWLASGVLSLLGGIVNKGEGSRAWKLNFGNPKHSCWTLHPYLSLLWILYTAEIFHYFHRNLGNCQRAQ